jgi:tetratricopeptide (TPR) repeat protein
MNTYSKIALDQARQAYTRGDHVRARAILREIAKRDPTNEQAYLLFAKVAQKREHAIMCYKRVLEINPDNPIALDAIAKIEAQAEATRKPVPPPVEAPAKDNLQESTRKRRLPSKNFRRRVLFGVVLLTLLGLATVIYYRPLDRGRTQTTQSHLTSEEIAQETTIAETKIAKSILNVNYRGRIFIQEGDPAAFEAVWDLISLEDVAVNTNPDDEKPEYWHTLDIEMSVRSEYPHTVKFRIMLEHPTSGSPIPVFSTLEILPNTALGLDPDEVQELRLSFYQWIPSMSESTRFHASNVEISRIDDTRREDWALPAAEKEYYRDIWLISNPTSEPQPIFWTMKKLDREGAVLASEEYAYCTREQGDYRSLYHQPSYLPPNASYVISKDISIEEDEAGITTSLVLSDLPACTLAESLGVSPSPSVKLTEMEEANGQVAMLVENETQKDAFGLLYVNIYDESDTLIHGQVVAIDAHNLPIPPEEEYELSASIHPPQWISPQPARFEIFFLGMSG